MGKTGAMSARFPSEVVRRRADIGEALANVERALSNPVGTGEAWRVRVAASLAVLGHLTDEQVEAYIAHDGVFDEVLESAPRLASQVDRLRSAIVELAPRIDKLVSAVADASPNDVREDALGILGDLVRARQKIADLVWDAFSLDLGGHSS
jgi:hypothetical protein